MGDAETLDHLIDTAKPGVPWEDAARAIGVSSTQLRLLRRGGIERPHRATVAAIARWCRVPVARVRAAIAASRAARGQ